MLSLAQEVKSEFQSIFKIPFETLELRGGFYQAAIPIGSGFCHISKETGVIVPSPRLPASRRFLPAKRG
jgi:hypothetical protein